MPTLIGPVSLVAALASGAAAASGAVAALEEGAGPSDFAAGPLHPTATGASAHASKLIQRVIKYLLWLKRGQSTVLKAGGLKAFGAPPAIWSKHRRRLVARTCEGPCFGCVSAGFRLAKLANRVTRLSDGHDASSQHAHQRARGARARLGAALRQHLTITGLFGAEFTRAHVFGAHEPNTATRGESPQFLRPKQRSSSPYFGPPVLSRAC